MYSRRTINELFAGKYSDIFRNLKSRIAPKMYSAFKSFMGFYNYTNGVYEKFV